MEYNGLPIPYIAPQIGNLSSGFHFFDDEDVNLESPPDVSIRIVDDDQPNLGKLERFESRDILPFTSMETILHRQEKIKSLVSGQPVMLNAVMISSFKDLISKIRNMIGEGSDASIKIYDLLLKNVFEVTGRLILGEGPFLFASDAIEFYTSSASICYFFHHLSKDNELQDRIRKEIKGNISEIEDLKMTFKEFTEKMPILSAAILETCRLTPSPRSWSATMDNRLTGLKIDDFVLPKNTDVIDVEFGLSAKNIRLWGEDAADFELERFLIIKDSGPKIDGKAIEKLVDEGFSPIGSALDKMFAFQQFMIGSVLLLDAFEFSGTHQLGMAGSNKPQQSWFDIAVTSSLTVSRAKN